MIPELERLGKIRHAFPMKVCGETIYIRALNKAERKEFKPIADKEESYGFILGTGLVNESGARVFDRVDGEDITVFSERVEDELGISDDIRVLLCTAIVKMSQELTTEQMKALKKN